MKNYIILANKMNKASINCGGYHLRSGVEMERPGKAEIASALRKVALSLRHKDAPDRLATVQECGISTIETGMR